MPPQTNQSGLFRSGRREEAKTLTDDCSTLQYLGLRISALHAGKAGEQAASNEPSCFSRCLKLAPNGRRTGLLIKQVKTPPF